MSPATETATGGTAVVEALVAAGIRHAFTVPGESFLGLLDALHDAPIRTVATRHEAGAAFMAEAVGQLTGRPALCLATRAVGAANLAIGLHTARADSTPLVAIIGQVPMAFRGREAFQEVDQAATFGRLCKAAVEVDDPALLAAETSRLVALARAGRPGPVLLALPEDVLDAQLQGATVHPAAADPERPAPRRPGATLTVLTALAEARTPVIVAGAGVLRAGATVELAAVAEATATPVIASWRRPDVVPNDHPLYLGMAGLGAPETVRERLLRADVILALGTRLNEITTFGYAVPAPGTRVLHVDIEPGWEGRCLPALAVRADARVFLEEALQLLARGYGRPSSPADRAAANARDRAALETAVSLPDVAGAGGVHPAAAVRALRRLLPPGAVLTTDAGNFASWYARHLPLVGSQRFLGPTSGAMGYGLPAAIGAAIADPARPVVALAGDGGLAMLMAELETAVRERARMVVIVHDNGRYGTIRMHQERSHPGRVTATELGPIDFAAVARACGADAVTVERDADVADALAGALAGEGVSLVHLRLDPAILSLTDRLA